MTTEEKRQTLAKIGRRLNAAGITWAVGASAMLYFRGIVSDFHDIDLMVTDDDAIRAGEILAGLGTLCPSEAAASYRSRYYREFRIDGVDVDLIGGFVIVRDGVAYDCPLRPEQIDGAAVADGTEIPLQSLACWQRYYTLMRRPERAEQIAAALREGIAAPSPTASNGRLVSAPKP